ncbi:chorismate synthase [Thermaurantimonas aggregans]|uniref:Chorismate synthase n=1 Tax=Thermaurantimonas aggregans TaxID=2173829 RepID=A0A401XLJ8_9FLAO|nr:chorismate synthase [Thermaurantimonas aggregans]MCX8149160.1 chorismate synthase [Thermaurantimonas aggregans]GCD77864.1 chorismate synthase [Thermaurantimonas aggregans]
MSNTFGRILRLTTFGESHGPAIGGVLDGFPAGVFIDFNRIRYQLSRRRPGQSAVTTARNEVDEPEFLSGIFEGKSTGAPIAFLIRNADKRSADYESLRQVFRPGHADETYTAKYGHRDHRGGGRSSARETANWVLAGALAAHLLPQVEVLAYTSQIGDVRLPEDAAFSPEDVDKYSTRMPHVAASTSAEKLITDLKEQGESVGGKVAVRVTGLPAGLGEPIFDKLHARLAHAMMTINATRAFEIGSGTRAASMRGSEHNDMPDDNQTFATNHSGGVLGGISTGRELTFEVTFKPTASIAKEQKALDTEGHVVDLAIPGRHDPCVVPRAVPVVEALTWLVLADFYLLNRIHTLY